MVYHPEQYWDKVAQNIQARKKGQAIAGDDEPYYRYKRKRFLTLLAKLDCTDKAVLEVGSGPGGNLLFLYNKGCRNIIGVDLSERMVALSKQLLTGKDIPVLKINGEVLPFQDMSFDEVFTTTVLQHITNERVLQHLCAEICRVARSEVWMFERIEKRQKHNGSNVGRPVEFYQRLLLANGFKLVAIHSLPIQVSYLVCGIIRRLLNSAGRQEGSPASKLTVLLQKIVLPFTSLADKLVSSKRDVMLLKFQRM